MDAHGRCVPFTAILSTRDYVDFRGMVGLGGEGKLVEGGAGEEFYTVMDALRKSLQSRGLDLDSVIEMMAYVKNSRDAAALKKVYAGFSPRPKRLLRIVVAKELSVEGARVEVDAVAYIRLDREVYSP